MKIWSSIWPAGVISKLPSGENVRRRKKRVTLSSPYRRCIMPTVGAAARIAGKGGMGDGDRPRPAADMLIAGDPGCCDENEDRREVGLPLEDGGGGCMVLCMLGVDGTETL